METGFPTRPRQPESEPHSEPSERNVTPCVESELSKRRMNGGDEEQPSTIIERDTSPVAAAAATPSETARPTNRQSFANLDVPADLGQHLLGRTPM